MSKTIVRYRPAVQEALAARALIANLGEPEQRRLVFLDRVEIGRDAQQLNLPAGKILVADKTVSGRHCVIVQNSDGRCLVRDTSRNGTRIDGRRLVPGIETEILPGQVLNIGAEAEFVFELLDDGPQAGAEEGAGGEGTMQVQTEPVDVTVLVGDIRQYTIMVQKAPPQELQDSVARLFATLESEVRRHGGMLKEYQGDAIFAYWESEPSPEHPVDACRAALDLANTVRRVALDKDVWDVPGFELEMDWSLATGEVVVATLGGSSPTGLSMIGEPVVLAFRLEKLATGEYGTIVTAQSTWGRTKDLFEFRDEGTVRVAGFGEPQRYFTLLGPRNEETHEVSG